jgi:hypothetical protein
MLTAAELRTLLRHHAPPRRCTEDGLPQTCTELRHAGVPVRLPAHLGQQPFACSYLQVDHELLVPSNGLCPQLLRPQPARLQRLQHGRRLLRDVRHTLHASTVRLGHRARPRLPQRAYVATALAPPPCPEGCSWLGAVVVAPYSWPLPSELVAIRHARSLHPGDSPSLIASRHCGGPPSHSAASSRSWRTRTADEVAGAVDQPREEVRERLGVVGRAHPDGACRSSSSSRCTRAM